MKLPQHEYEVMKRLAALESGAYLALEDVCARTGLDQVHVTVAAQMLAGRGWLAIDESSYVELRLGKAGEQLASDGFPERRAITAIAAAGGRISIAGLADKMAEMAMRSPAQGSPLLVEERLAAEDLAPYKKLAGESIKHLEAKGWAQREKSELVLTAAGRAALDSQAKAADERLVEALSKRHLGGPLVVRIHEGGLVNVEQESNIGNWPSGFSMNPFTPYVDGKSSAPSDDEERQELARALELLRGRRDALQEKKRTRRRLALTEAGRARWAEGVEVLVEVTQLTSELLIGGKWRDVEIKRYDVSLDVAPQYGGKPHPFRRVLDETRDVFLQMGFSEIDSPHVESAFWDFDALFQPQDHPAREMQDTFYLARPHQTNLPGDELIAKVKETHETGGDTGSLGWQYRWQLDKAQKAVLRTHTTAATIRALAEEPHGPRKVFCVGRVFRREAIDYKHLPVFYQVDGIIIDENATFANLLGTLSAFYRKMGFEKFDFRPAFFPYTEPSVEVFVWMEQRKDWVEMGGAGIFRPEVTIPFGCHAPVLAWGLGLERLAMFRFELDDIRQIYQSDVKWLREVPLCR